MTTKNSITFRFIRDNSVKGDTDDIATISYAGKNNYNVSFQTTYSENAKRSPTTMCLDDRQTFRWVRRVLSLLECDTDPFTGIQVDMPMMPSVMLKVQNVSKDYSSLLDAIEFQMDNWGNTVCKCEMKKVKVPNAPARRNYREEEDDEYEDMPSLIPIRSESAFHTPARVNRQHLFFDDDE